MTRKEKYFWFYLTLTAYVLSALLLWQSIAAGRVWWWDMMSLIPSWFWLVIPLATLTLFCFRRKNFALLACGLIGLILAMGQADINIGALFPRNPVSTNTTISVFSWNSLAWRQQKRQEWIEYIRSQNSDVLMLQEIIPPRTWDTPNPADLAELFPGYRLIPHGEFLTITKLPVVAVYGSTEQFWLRVDVAAAGRTISLYNVHIPVHMNPGMFLRTPGKFFADMKDRHALRAQQFALLDQELQNNPHEKIIAGDFNTTKSMGYLDFLRSYSDITGLSKELFPSSWGDYGIYLWRIDWAFMSKSLQAIDFTYAARTPLSDHVAMRFTVGLPESVPTY